jgi:hypothetical protein
MRLTGGGRETATVARMKPSRKCSKPGSLKPGEALESEDKVKPVNARKHRESEPSHTGLFKAGAKRQAVESGSSNVARRTLSELPV